LKKAQEEIQQNILIASAAFIGIIPVMPPSWANFIWALTQCSQPAVEQLYADATTALCRCNDSFMKMQRPSLRHQWHKTQSPL
jgi:hypothetical protein